MDPPPVWMGIRRRVRVSGGHVPGGMRVGTVREFKWAQKGLKASQMAQNRPKMAKVGSKWVKMAQNTFKMAQSRIKMGQNRPTLLKMAQNRPKMAQSRAKHNGTETATKYLQGHSGWHRCAAFGPPRPNLGRKRGLKAPFAAKFGMNLGVLAVFSGPVHDHVRQQTPALRMRRLGARR